MPVTTYAITYANRTALIADGWDFQAKTAGGSARNTENAGRLTYSGSGLTVAPLGSGELYGASNASENTILRDLPSGWTEIIAKLNYTGTAGVDYQAGLVLYQDDSNFIEVSRGRGGNWAVTAEVAGSNTVDESLWGSSSTNPWWAKISKSGNVYTLYYSTNGSSWTTMRTVTQTLTTPRMALYTAAPGGPASTATWLEASVDAPISATVAGAGTITATGAVRGIAYGASGAINYGTTSLAVALPTGVTAGQLLVVKVGARPGATVSIVTPTGWSDGFTRYGESVGTFGTDGGDAGPTRVVMFTKIAAGTESGTLAITVTGGNACWGQVDRFTSGTGVFDLQAYTAEDSSSDTTYSAAATSGAGALIPGDVVLVAHAKPTDAGTYSAETIAATGLTFGTIAEIAEYTTINGNDMGGASWYGRVTSGTQSGTTITAGATLSASMYGPASILRIRDAVSASTASLTGAGTITATGSVGSAPPASTLTGTGTITATGTVAYSGTATLSGVGSITPAAGGTTLVITPHQDDDLYFMSPDIITDADAGKSFVVVYLTAGDAGNNSTYWQGRETGARAGWDSILGSSPTWTTGTETIDGKTVRVANRARVKHIYLAMPDGGVGGAGYVATGSVAIMRLWTGALSSISSLDTVNTWTKVQLLSFLRAVADAAQADQVRTAHGVPSTGTSDHSDHMATGRFAASAMGGKGITFTGYQGYQVSDSAVNVTGSLNTRKMAALNAYGAFDALALPISTNWGARQYSATPSGPVAGVTGAGGGGTNIARDATVYASSENALDTQTVIKAIDGVISGYDGGSGDYTKEWVTLGEIRDGWIELRWATPQTITAVNLYDRPNTTDQITAGELTFSSGSPVSTGSLTNNGTVTAVSFSARTVTWVRFTWTTGNGSNNGLAEIQAIAGGIAALAGTGVITATGAVVGGSFNGTATLSGSGAITTAGALGFTGTSSLNGAGTIVTTGVTARSSAATLAGTGSITAAGTAAAATTATLAGSGSITTTGVTARTSTATLAGVGSITTAGSLAGGSVQQTASLAGTGVITATGALGLATSATLNGSGSTTATGSTGRASSATLTGAGTITATGTSALSQTATLAGAGTITATGISATGPSSTLTGTGSISATGQLGLTSSATLSGTGTITATGATSKTSTATLTGTGSTTATGSKGVESTATLTGAGTIAATGAILGSNGAIVSGAGTIAATGSVGLSGTATLPGVGTIIASAPLALYGLAHLIAIGTISAFGYVPFVDVPTERTLVGSYPMATLKATPVDGILVGASAKRTLRGASI
jgi:LmbE family N-acetylglucosaminyl deacetylase/regulation of enolase protein 1 (concanavalin A-like superfamily)